MTVSGRIRFAAAVFISFLASANFSAMAPPVLSFKERIDELNTCDPSKYLPFLCAGKQVGAIRRDRAALLRDFRDILVIADKDVLLAPSLGDHQTRTEAMTRVIAVLFGKGEIPRLRRESYSVVPLDDRTLSTPPLFEVDRAACPYFGIRAFGVHVNGFVREGAGFSLWIARRSKTAGVHPNKLDNMVAGGQPAELTVFANMMKAAPAPPFLRHRFAAWPLPTDCAPSKLCVSTQPSGVSTPTRSASWASPPAVT